MRTDVEPTAVQHPSKPPSTVLRAARARPLEPFFRPRSVAVVGATEKAGSVGRTLFWNLVSSPFGGTVFPVNPKRGSILGIKAYESVAALPEPAELAVVVTPAAAAPGVVRECVEAGIQAAIVISAGFKEVGPEGAALERQLVDEARRGNMRVVGPNCLGVMCPVSGLNATFAGGMARPGNVAFISQSGALCTAVLDWSLRESVGFSAFVSIGSMADVGWGDLIDFLGDDPRTKSIIMYMESIGDARSFLSAAREVALTKPIIVIKTGRTQAAARAAASHTGAMTGSDDVLDAALRRCGVLRVDSIAELFYMAEILAKQPRPAGPRLAIVTNAGGPGVLATDELVAHGGELAPLSPETMAALDALLPPHWSHGNPIDVLGDAEPERYAKALDVAARDPNSDGTLVILTPQSMTDPTATAERIKACATSYSKPVLASWMGGAGVAAGESILSRAEIATFPYPDTAARMFAYMWRYSDNLRGVYETPAPLAGDPEEDVARRGRVAALLGEVGRRGRTLLTEVESKQVLSAYQIPVVDTRPAATEDDAVHAARAIGYPAVVKVWSETITHKTDVGGVELDLRDDAAVRAAFRRVQASVTAAAGREHFLGVTVQRMVELDGYELIVGSSIDPSFGPVLLFGSGGQLVEVYKDRALALPPLTTTLARRMMERTKILAALGGVRGRAPVDRAALEQLLVRFSWLVVEQPRIKEIDINPLLASPAGLLALDARVLLHAADVADDQLPRSAVRGYPTQYVGKWTAKDGTELTIRPIRPEDEPLMVKFHGTLSERAVYLRYFAMLNISQRTAHERLIRICFIDYDREMALVAVRRDPGTGEADVLGIGRLTKIPGRNDGEFAILIADRHQNNGIGTELLSRLVAVGRREKLERIVGHILPENRVMQRTSEKVGFRLVHAPEEGLVTARMDL
ncbi:MAG TPA: bifunctional acetate--CoA ligase family protein/GNAT family N-acetyltransferase [Polyangiaceae bacterium]|nr:bifunctional acetate--CoA ligase family protein/GNAT family N-acetyltransferase [Polyangiaceae bacterium]